MRFMELIEKMRFHIVIQDEQDLPLWEKINYAGRFDPLVSTFVDKLARDALFSEYFAENMMMKHMIHQIVTTFFAHSAQRANGTAPQLNTYGIALSKEQFEKSKELFREACKIHKVNPLIKDEAVLEYEKLGTFLAMEASP